MVEDLDATTPTQRIARAVAALVGNSPHLLDRGRDTARADADAAHVAHIRYLRRRLELARDDVDRARILCDAREAGRRHRVRRAARAAVLGRTPSIVEQLLDAVHSRSGGGTGTGGVHRSPFNAAAVALLHRIRRTVATDDRDPTAALRAFAAELEHSAEDATAAEEWLAEARMILEPEARIEANGPCPVCGERYVHVTEGGERIRRSAVQINLTTREGRCYAPSCTGYWDSGRIELLASILRQDAAEEAATRARPEDRAPR